jgi:hypothetical protein
MKSKLTSSNDRKSRVKSRRVKLRSLRYKPRATNKLLAARARFYNHFIMVSQVHRADPGVALQYSWGEGEEHLEPLLEILVPEMDQNGFLSVYQENAEIFRIA